MSGSQWPKFRWKKKKNFTKLKLEKSECILVVTAFLSCFVCQNSNYGF